LGRTAHVPSAPNRATKISRVLASLKTNARPSGDHRATDGRRPACVTWTGLAPSLSQTHNCSYPDRSDRKQILSPRGEYCGDASWPEDEMSRVQRPVAAPLACKSRRQMDKACWIMEYTRTGALRASEICNKESPYSAVG